MSHYYDIDILLRTFLSRHWPVTLCFRPSDPIVIVGYGVGPNRTLFSEAGRVLCCLLGRLGNVCCQVT